MPDTEPQVTPEEILLEALVRGREVIGFARRHFGWSIGRVLEWHASPEVQRAIAGARQLEDTRFGFYLARRRDAVTQRLAELAIDTTLPPMTQRKAGEEVIRLVRDQNRQARAAAKAMPAAAPAADPAGPKHAADATRDHPADTRGRPPANQTADRQGVSTAVDATAADTHVGAKLMDEPVSPAAVDRNSTHEHSTAGHAGPPTVGAAKRHPSPVKRQDKRPFKRAASYAPPRAHGRARHHDRFRLAARRSAAFGGVPRPPINTRRGREPGRRAGSDIRPRPRPPPSRRGGKRATKKTPAR